LTKRKTTRRKKITLDDLPQALQDLDINVPYYDARLVGNRIELHLYGGRVVRWPRQAQYSEPEPNPPDLPNEED
jgi:hypothetical protein